MTILAEAAAAPGAGGFGMLPMMVILFGIFYFMMIRPQQRKEKERLKMISELRAGKRIAFAGGLLGTITEAKEGTFMVEIAHNVKIEIARSAVSQVLADEDAAEAKKA